jgi:membrane-bound lytic murein transglycosylase D
MPAKPLTSVLLVLSMSACVQVPTESDAVLQYESRQASSPDARPLEARASPRQAGVPSQGTSRGAIGSTAAGIGTSTTSTGGIALAAESALGAPGTLAAASGDVPPGAETGAAAPSATPAADAAPQPTLPQAAEPSPPPVHTIWDRIRKGFELAPMDNALVREWENWYASRPDYVARMIDRSSRFLFHIVEEVEKRRMPTEVALLPMIESAYNPIAYSTAHASGIWQFIPSTGKDFGLRQNWWYDGRRDVIAATTAALDYLEKLYGMFGDWPLALASYNWGEGSVSRAIERNRARGLRTDYESLTMPSETRSYLPKLIAVKNIIANPARYGLEIAHVPNEPFFEIVKLRRHIDLKLAAKLADMSVQEFKFLNPGHNKPVIRATEAERIVLPRDKVAAFHSNFEKHDRPLVSWQAVTLRAGQKPERVAAEHGITLAELKQVNGLENKKILTGQPLLVPLKDASDEPQLPELPARPVTLPKAIQVARTAAAAKTVAARSGGARVTARKTGPRTLVSRAARPAPRQLRAEQGKRVKVVASRPAAKQSDKSGGRMKIASRD